MSETTAPRLNDFPDWISPMLVKELRQGLRTKVFVFTFIALQVAMTLSVIVGLLVAAGGAETAVLSGFLWAIIWVAMLIVIPFSALGSLGGEIRAKTLELVLLSRLSAWRITWGKWFAVVAQTALFVCAVLPYIVLRYFMGGVNITSDLARLGLMFAGSITLSAAMVAISAYANWIARVILGLGVLFALNMVPSIFLMLYFKVLMMGGGTGAASIDPILYAVGTVYAALFILLMLQIGAGLIAPSSENHSAIKRLIGVGFLALAIVSTCVLNEPQVAVIFCLLACGPILFGAVCEHEQDNLSIYRPFVRRGLAGRLAGRFFYAGWPAGIAFSALLLAGFAALMWTLRGFDETGARTSIVAIVGTVAFVGVIIRVFFPQSDKNVGVLIVVFALSTFLAVLAGVLDSALNWDARTLACFIPPAAFILNMFQDGQLKNALLAVSVSTGLCAFVLFVFLVRGWLRMPRFERAALESGNGMA